MKNEAKRKRRRKNGADDMAAEWREIGALGFAWRHRAGEQNVNRPATLCVLKGRARPQRPEIRRKCLALTNRESLGSPLSLLAIGRIAPRAL